MMDIFEKIINGFRPELFSQYSSIIDVDMV